MVVVILPDTGRNYLSRLFSDRWMREKGLVDRAPAMATAGDVLARKQAATPLIAVAADAMAIDAFRLMERDGISQLPVLEAGRAVGSLSEVTLVKLLHDGCDLRTRPVRDVMGQPLPEVDETVDLGEPYRLLLAGYGGVVVTRAGSTFGFLARIDLVDFWAQRLEQRHA